LVSHFSNLEIAHGLAISFTIAVGMSGEPASRRVLFLASLGAGAAVSLAISPWPLTLLFNREALPYAEVFHSDVTIPSPAAIVRMYGPGLSIAGALCMVWIVIGIKRAHRFVNGALIGLCLFGAITVAPLFAAAAGVDIPISLSVYRFFLAAALPLALLVTLAAGRARRSSLWGSILAAVAGGVLMLDIVFRSVHMPFLVIAAVVVAGFWWYLSSPKTAKRLSLGAGFALICAVSTRPAVWMPVAPVEAAWLSAKGDSGLPVVTNWPLTNALDALVDQRVIDGLAGRDGNVARHRSMPILPLHDRVDWCGEAKAAAVDSLIAALAETGDLPAYLVFGERFAESWRLYAEQHARRVAEGDIADFPFFAADPCGEPHARRIEAAD
jgi:hypothetical protein